MGSPPSTPAQRGVLRDLRERARALLVRAKDEHSTPPEVGFSVAVGVFAACTPFLGFHMWIALGLATLFRLNRLWAFLGSRATFMPIILWVAFSEVELGHRLRSGAWVPMNAHEALARGRDLGVDWVIGSALVGGIYATFAGLGAYAVARRWEADAPVTPRKLDAPRPPSSEFPPSTPPGSRS